MAVAGGGAVDRGLSLVADRGPYSSTCGYCHGALPTSAAYGMQARCMTVYDYQDLIDQGWRRAGTFLYKFDMAATCCQAYTIRLDVLQFKLSKAHKQLLRKWRRYLATGNGAAPMDTADQDDTAAAALSGSSCPFRPAAGGAAPAADRQQPTTQPPSASQPQEQHRHAQQQQQQQQQRGAGDGDDGGMAQLLARLLASALAWCIGCGQVPPVSPPGGVSGALPVKACPASQLKHLPPGTRYTSGAAFALAAAAAKARAAAPAAPAGTRAAHAAPAPAAGMGPGPELASGAAAPSRPTNAGDENGAAVALVVAADSGPHAAAKIAAKRAAQKANLPPPGLAHAIADALAARFNSLVADAGGSGIAGTSQQQQQQRQEPGLGPSGSSSPAEAAAAVAAAASAAASAGVRAEAVNGHVNFVVAGSNDVDMASEGGQSGQRSAAQQQPVRAQCATHVRHHEWSPRQCGQRRSLDTARTAAAVGTSSGGMDARCSTSPPGPTQAPATSVAATAEEQQLLALLQMPPGRFEITMVRSAFSEEEFELYKRYQVSQHGDAEEQLSPRSFKRFLVDTPLPHVGRQQDPRAPQCGYGSFHQQYRLDGKLIAVGVVDVLPRCLSSKYFFWDPDYAFLAPGRFSALQEILWVAQAHASGSADLHSYYMGFYIHTCPKMRYKAEYQPSDLLCPKTNVWVRITSEVLTALERHARQRASDGCSNSTGGSSSACAERGYVVLSDLPGALTFPNAVMPQPLGEAQHPPQLQQQQPAIGGTAAATASTRAAREHLAAAGPRPRLASTREAGDGGGMGAEGAEEAQDGGGLGLPSAAEEALGEVLMMMPGIRRPLACKALRQLGVFPGGLWTQLVQALQAWREQVGPTYRTLVYELS